MITLEEKLATLSQARQDKAERRAQELLAEELSLRELRKAHRLTQVQVAKSLGIGQDSVARLEQRSDLLLSTLRHYVKSMGGSLSIVARFPNSAPVVLSGIGDTDPKLTGRGRGSTPGQVKGRASRVSRGATRKYRRD
jgi:DNA-binding XRE family transcriptional regulator